MEPTIRYQLWKLIDTYFNYPNFGSAIFFPILFLFFLLIFGLPLAIMLLPSPSLVFPFLYLTVISMLAFPFGVSIIKNIFIKRLEGEIKNKKGGFKAQFINVVELLEKLPQIRAKMMEMMNYRSGYNVEKLCEDIPQWLLDIKRLFIIQYQIELTERFSIITPFTSFEYKEIWGLSIVVQRSTDELNMVFNGVGLTKEDIDSLLRLKDIREVILKLPFEVSFEKWRWLIHHYRSLLRTTVN